jgi:DNA-binding transcriptional ArsR family regulator
MVANMFSKKSSDERLSGLFEMIGQPTRLKIMLVLGDGEACVCHLEAVLGIRQATISQHLMVLRDADLVTTQRDGRNIFYRLAKPELFAAICQFASVTGVSSDVLTQFSCLPVPNCPCPRCNPDLDPTLTCQKIKGKRS